MSSCLKGTTWYWSRVEVCFDWFFTLLTANFPQEKLAKIGTVQATEQAPKSLNVNGVCTLFMQL